MAEKSVFDAVDRSGRFGLTAEMKDWLQLAFDRAVVRRALICVVIVGAVLIAINHGSALLAGELPKARLVQIGMALLVPYCVSTYSSVAAMRAAARDKNDHDERK
jgi:hypothetical protein